jgi:GTP cyclohydrolase II
MEQGRDNTSAIPHEMLGTRTETMKTAQTGILWRIASTRMPTKWGMFSAIGFERQVSNGQDSNGQVSNGSHSNGSQWAETALAIVLGDLTGGAPLLRIHSQCFTGEVLGSLRCDCNDQLEMAMKTIATEGRGLVIYEYQEGRGIGLMAKLQAYELQDAGIDTVQANHALGFKSDCRDFSLPAAILHDLGIKRVRLLTNNPRKAVALADTGIEVVARIPCEVAPTPYSLAYLQTKKEKMGHALSLRGTKGDGSSQFGARGSIFPVANENRASNAGWRVQGIEAQL